MTQTTKTKPAIGRENFIFLGLFLAFFGWIGHRMGVSNMMMTLMATAYDLLINICFNIMAISVLAGAISGVFSEFGVIALIDHFLAKIIGPIYDLPGAASLGILNCYLSDNPAILTLADDENFLQYFKDYQIPALTNLGTAFGMGLIITTTVIGFDLPHVGMVALIGNLGAIIGSVVSVRLMLFFTKRHYGTQGTESSDLPEEKGPATRTVRSGSAGTRLIESLLDGGKSGVDMGLAIIPGVLIICSLVLLLTDGPGADGLYHGALGEGVPLLPYLGNKLSFVLQPLFGFSFQEAISVPITALGSAGAAIGMVGNMVQSGLANPKDVAVFTSICMCWSGYLSTHVAMMDALGTKEMTGKTIFSHTIGGLAAGASANLIFSLWQLL